MDINSTEIFAAAQHALDTEIDAISQLQQLLADDFITACSLMINCKGRVIVLGIGKSGHIGKKIAATFASTGTPAFFVHPAEASHGDLGMITSDDTILLLSYSGESEELIALLPSLKRLQTPIIAITGQEKSTLASHADTSLVVHIKKEAGPLNLAPTASTTAMLVLGDILAVAMLRARGFNEDDFAKTHPGGSLGKRLLLKVTDMMHKETELPTVTEGATLAEAILQATGKGFGVCFIINSAKELVGVFTDGDLRRGLEKNQLKMETPITELMSTHPKSVSPDLLAAEAVALMAQHHITALAVVDKNQHLCGILHMHDLLKAKII